MKIPGVFVFLLCGVCAMVIHKELMTPLPCGVFLMERAQYDVTFMILPLNRNFAFFLHSIRC